MRPPRLKQVLQDAALPPRLTKRIRRIAHRTRLRRRERARVAEMLSAESAERLAAGEPERAILASLRPVARTGRRLRREMLRAAPLRRIAWGSLTWIKHSIASTLLVAVIAYSYFFWRFHAAELVLSRNIAAEHNARFSGIPESDLAAPLYREAYAALEKFPREERGTLDREWPEVYPGNPLWPEALAYLDRNAEPLALLLDATAKPYAGFRLSLRPHLQPDTGPPLPAGSALAANPPVLDLVLDSLGPYRSFAGLLSVDARAAAEAGDGARSTADLLAMLHLCRHSEEHGVTIADLVCLAIHDRTAATLADILSRHPDLLDQDMLAAIGLAFRASMVGEIRADIAREEEFLYDLTQRLYSNNGSGNGHVCAAGLRYLDSVANGAPGRLNIVGYVVGPLNAAVLPSRRDFMQRYHDVLGQFQELSARPYWEWERLPDDIIEDELARTPGARVRAGILLMLLPAYGKVVHSHEVAAQTRDAALVMLALARHHLDHGRYPDALDALVPHYLPEIPPDRFDGGPIKYRLADDGTPLLYSVGADRRDDDGFPRENDRDGTAAMEWHPPSEAHLLPPGDWIILPRPRPEPYSEGE